MSRALSLTSLLLFACDSDKGVTAFNSKPEASITSHTDGDEVLEGVLVTLRGSASDANHSYDQLTATWYVGSEVICEATVPESDGTVQCEMIPALTDSEVTLEVKDAGNATGSESVSLTVVPTEAPEAMIITPEASGVYYSDQKITFEGLVSDEEDDSELLVASWTSDLDGELTDVDSNPDGGGSILGYGYLTEGEHAIELSVEDTTGKTDRASVIIDVGPPNSAPLCDITAPADGAAGPEGDSIQFAATASDVDVPSDMLTVTWSSDKDGELGESTPTSAGEITFSYSDLSVNQHNITMTVSDEIGATCTTAINYTVGTPPSIVIEAPADGDVINEGESIPFSATVSDAQDQADEVSLDWSLNGLSISTQGATSSGTAAFSDASLAYGSYNLVVTATDTDGLTDSDQINFTVNGLPAQPVIGITPDPADTSDALTVSIVTPSTDPEGSTVNYSYEWLMGGAVQSVYTSSTVPSTATNKNEQWTVRVTPNDGIADGPVGEATITIANTAPTLSALAITPASNVTNDITLSCSVVVTDPDETVTPIYEWAIGSSVVGSGSTLNLSSTGAMPEDVVSCTVSVVDGDGATATDSTTVTVQNRDPSVTGAAITPSAGITTETALTCAATVSDDDGESPTVTTEWLVGSATYTGASLALDNMMVSPSDSITCVVSAIDGYGGTASDSASVSVDNTLPTVTASIFANGNTNTGELTCFATASDVDDIPTPSLSYEWFDASGASLGSNNPLPLDPSMGVDGDDISCVATATDLSGGSASDTAIHTITNTPPVIDSIAINPNTIDATTYYIGCTPIGSDADGDAVSFAYAWHVDGVLQSNANTNIFLQAWVPATEITCRATPNDGKEDGAYAEASVVVDNTPPYVDSVSLSPSTVYTNDTLTASAVLSDNDSMQSVSGSYAWHVIDFATGMDTEVQSGNDNTLSGVTHFDRDDEVYVIVTPNDGIEDGTPVTSSSITVLNTAPTAPDVSISPDPAIAGQDDLICSVDAPSSDDDGDPVVYTYVWTDDSGLVQQTTVESAATTDSILAAGVGEGAWACEVTPYDLDLYGPPSLATVSVENGCNSLYFDGVDDHVLIGDQAQVSALSEVSFGAWIYLESHSGWQSIVGKYHNDSFAQGEYLIQFDASVVRVVYQTANGSAFREINHTLPTQQWMHLATSYDGVNEASFKLYINGVEQNLGAASSSISGPMIDSDEPLYFGAREDANIQHFHGNIARVALFDRALSATEMNTMMTDPQSIPNLVGDWKLNQSSGQQALDASGNGLHGSIHGATWDSTCPEEDIDGDGVPAWDDCDDTDPTLFDRDGLTQACPASSCKMILDDGFSTGNGLYWIDPDGAGAFEAYCDMTTDGGGWTLVGAWANMGGYAMENFPQGRNPSVVSAAHHQPLPGGSGSNSGPSHYGSSILNALFHQGNGEYLTLTGSQYLGAIIVRFTKNQADSSYDAFRGVYETSYMMNNGFTAVEQGVSTNQNPLPLSNPSWSSVAISARTTTSGNYHYLPDDITESYQWLFRENIDDTPNSAKFHSSNVPSLLWIR